MVLALTRCSIKVASFEANWERFFPSLLSLIHTCTCAITLTKHNTKQHTKVLRTSLIRRIGDKSSRTCYHSVYSFRV